MTHDKRAGARNRRVRRWTALERIHLRGVARAVPVAVIGSVLALFAIFLTALPMPQMVKGVLLVFGLLGLLGSLGFFARHLTICLYARGLVADAPRVKTLQADRPEMDERTAEWLVARRGLIRGLLSTGCWLTAWTVAAGWYAYPFDEIRLLVGSLFFVPVSLWMLVILTYRVISLIWISVGFGQRIGRGLRGADSGS